MQPHYLELRTRRELGTILSDSFTFIRINLSSLWKVLLQTSGIYFLLTVLMSGLYQYAILTNWMITDISLFVGVLLLMLLASSFFAASAAAGVFAFMQNYMDTKGVVQEEEIIRDAKGKTGQYVLLTILCYLIVCVGLVFFIIPGIYFLVPISLVFPIYYFKNLGKTESIGAAFKLVSGYWWVTFGTLLVVLIVIGIISIAFNFPSSIYLAVKSIFSNSAENVALSGDFIYLILVTLGSAASNLLSIITIIAISLIYFDLDEEKNRTGILAKLEDLG